jgi:hypothetical protein
MSFLRKLRPDPLDVLHVIGFSALIWGLWQVYHPLAWMAAGVIVMRYSYLVSVGRRHTEE